MTDAMEDGTAAAAALVVGRVPVVDEAGTIVGFELVNRASAGHGASTTAQGREAVVSMSGLLGTVDVDVDSVVGDRLLFCTIGRDVLVGDSPLHLSPRRTVVEVPMLADDPELLEAVRAFRDVGFTVLVPHSARTPGTAGLLDLADLVKVDLGTGTPEEVMDVVQGYAGGPADLLAAGCDTEERLAWAQAVGFQLFSGSAVKSPPVSGSSTIAPSALSQVQLDPELRRAAFRRQGDLGNLITTLEVHERTIGAGRAPDPAHGDTTEVEAMAFTWAAGQASTMAPAGAGRSYRPRRRPALR